MIYKESTTSRANSAEQAEQSMQCTSSCSEQELTREEKRREEKQNTCHQRRSSSWDLGVELLGAGIPWGTTKTERLGAPERGNPWGNHQNGEAGSS